MRINRAVAIVLVAAAMVGGTTACAAAPAESAPPPTHSMPSQSMPSTASPPSRSGAVGSASGAVTEFKGHIECGPPVRSETSKQAGDHQEFRGGAWAPTATEMSDPRLAGTYTISSDTDVYPGSGSGQYTLGSERWRIKTSEGAWETSFAYLEFPDGYVSTVTTPLVGEGAYDGLFAIWEADFLGDAGCAWDIRGVIFPAAPPAPPIPPDL
jgi:hypothetical protein